jgi:putative hydrolase
VTAATIIGIPPTSSAHDSRGTDVPSAPYNDPVSDEPFDLPPDLLGRIPLFAELAKVLSWTGGPVNWDLARQIAVALAAGEESRHQVEPTEDAELAETIRVAELWLAEGPALPTPPRVATVRASTPAGWAERATAFREIVDPLAAKVVAAMSEQSGRLASEGEAAMLGPVLAQMAPVLLGIQTGVVLGTLANGVFGTYDVPLPVAEEGTIDVVLSAVDAFADSFQLDRRETRLHVALHQSAHRIVFEALPGVSAHFFALFHNYVAALDVDLSGAIERLHSLDVTSPERMQEAMEQEGFFGLLDSPATEQAVERVQRLISLVEAYADRAVEAAASRLPSAPRIGEAFARRRAVPDAGERMFRRFIGLELRPGTLRAAESFSRGVLDAEGWPALTRLWDDAENLPSDAELADPRAWLARVAG